jgi:hypothetical protein
MLMIPTMLLLLLLFLLAMLMRRLEDCCVGIHLLKSETRDNSQTVPETGDSIGSGDLHVVDLFSYMLVSLINQRRDRGTGTGGC